MLLVTKFVTCQQIIYKKKKILVTAWMLPELTGDGPAIMED